MNTLLDSIDHNWIERDDDEPTSRQRNVFLPQYSQVNLEIRYLSQEKNSSMQSEQSSLGMDKMNEK
jgi:hypothetical protein